MREAANAGLCPCRGEFFSNKFSRLEVPLLMWDKNAERRLGAEEVLPSLEMRQRQLHEAVEDMNFTAGGSSIMFVNRR